MDIINLLSLSTSIILFVVTCFVVKPLTTSIESLKTAIAKLDDIVELLSTSASTNRVGIAKIDESWKSAHKRIDLIEERMHDVEKRCIGCTCRKE